MSSFLFEKEQINCACFQSSPQNIRTIFRSQTYQSSSKVSKNGLDTSLKNQSQKSKNKKKSLKRDKGFQGSVSQNEYQHKQAIIKEILIPDIQTKNNKKQNKIVNFQPMNSEKIQSLRTQRPRHTHSVRMSNYPIQAVSQHFIVHIPQKNHQYSFSEHIIPAENIQQYEKLVQQEFKKDLNEYKLQMELKQKQKKQDKVKTKDYPQKINKQKQIPRIHIDDSQKSKSQNKQIRLSNKQIQEIQNFIQNANISKNNDKKTLKRRQSINNKKLTLDKLDSLPQMPFSTNFQKSLNELKDPPVRKQRKQSFRNSMICHKQKEQRAKKLKDKMYAKQIQSQKDGSSSSESDKQSQVVGRGWDGLTQQKLQIQELDQMMKNQHGHSQTMVTQQSNIKNSQIKTFTDYSASFISPKSQTMKPMITSTAFGGPKYAISGTSYQNFEELRKIRNSAHGHNQF